MILVVCALAAELPGFEADVGWEDGTTPALPHEPFEASRRRA